MHLFKHILGMHYHLEGLPANYNIKSLPKIYYKR
ncbi:unknown [Odoribacter sp. CAG:788]|nr:unknown [Odoribacter sp. CAG:788]